MRTSRDNVPDGARTIEERGDKAVRRPLAELLWCPHLLDDAVVEHRDPVG
jgi:hypothetical protein